MAWKYVVRVVGVTRASDLVLVILYCGSDMPLYAFSLFLPSIINQVSTRLFDWSFPLTDLHIFVFNFSLVRYSANRE
jgi:hypothetical protein